MEWTVSLAQEIAAEQANGRVRGGAVFVVGDQEEVLARSRPLRLDPLAGHAPQSERLDDPGARATLKQLARLGHAVVVSDEGVALSVVRLPSLPFGGPDDPEVPWGGRLTAAAAITGATGAAAVVVSGDTRVRVFEAGRLAREFRPRQKHSGRSIRPEPVAEDGS